MRTALDRGRSRSRSRPSTPFVSCVSFCRCCCLSDYDPEDLNPGHLRLRFFSHNRASGSIMPNDYNNINARTTKNEKEKTSIGKKSESSAFLSEDRSRSWRVETNVKTSDGMPTDYWPFVRFDFPKLFVRGLNTPHHTMYETISQIILCTFICARMET